MIAGSLLGIVFAASSVYLGLKVGLTVSASIPIAVLSVTLFRAFGHASIRENNIVQTTGSAGESIAAGVAFTLPALLLMGFDLELVRITLVALLGGTLGALLMIPLRRGLIVEEHERLPYPEGTACAQVLIAGDRGGRGARTVFGGFGVGALFSLLGNIGRFFGETASWSLSKLLPAGSFSVETNPALLGVGYVIGTRIAAVMLAGGLLSYLVLIPAVAIFGPDLTSPLVRAGALPVREMSPGQIRNAFVLYVGAGAVAAGGIVALLRSLPSIWEAFRHGLAGLGAHRPDRAGRTDSDLPMTLVLGGVLAIGVGVAVSPVLEINAISAALIVLLGFFFVTVSSRITGEIGSSSNPISGMTVATLLATCLLFVAAGWTGIPYKRMALSMAAIVCVAAANGGTTSQDLKTGFLVRAAPRAQQIAILIGVVTSALAIGWTLLYLNRAATTYVARSYPDFVATPAALAAAPDRLFAAGETAHLRGADYRVLEVRETTSGVPRGRYLLDGDDRIAFLVDPGVCGVEPEQRAPDGRIEKVVSKFDAPKAQLFRLIIDGVLGRELPWGLVLLGVALALVMELCGVPSLPFAVGVYLPLSTSAAIAIGGLVRRLADGRTQRAAADAESSPGTLFASGLIAGGAIAGLAAAALAGIDVEVSDTSGVVRPVPLAEHYGLTLAPRLLGPDLAAALQHHAAWSITPFLALALALFAVASRRR